MKTLRDTLLELRTKGLTFVEVCEKLAAASNTTPEVIQKQIITTWSKVVKDYEADREKTRSDFNEKWVTNHPNFPAYKIRNLWETAFNNAKRAKVGEVVRVYADDTKKRIVSGKLVKVTPHYIRFTRCSAKVVFRVVLECGIRTDKPKIEKVVYIESFPAYR